MQSYLNGNRNHVQNLVNKTHRELNPHLFEPEAAMTVSGGLPPPPAISSQGKRSSLSRDREPPPAKQRRSRFDEPPAVGPFAQQSNKWQDEESEKALDKPIAWPTRIDRDRQDTSRSYDLAHNRQDMGRSYDTPDQRPDNRRMHESDNSRQDSRRSYERDGGRASYDRQIDEHRRSYSRGRDEVDWSQSYRERSREDERRSYDLEREDPFKGQRQSKERMPDETPAMVWGGSAGRTTVSSGMAGLDPARSRYQTQAAVETFSFSSSSDGGSAAASTAPIAFRGNEYGSNNYPTSSKTFGSSSAGGDYREPHTHSDYGGRANQERRPTDYSAPSANIWQTIKERDAAAGGGKQRDTQVYDPFRPTESPPPAASAPVGNIPPPPSITGWGGGGSAGSEKLSGFSSSFSFSGDDKRGSGSAW
jgi:hypothetical protein